MNHPAVRSASSSRTASAPRAVDVLVVGAGVMGAAAAWRLAAAGRRPVLLEQLTIGHPFGSSHGGSRIFRYAHPEHDLVGWMPATLALWQALEQEAATPLLTLTGGLFAGPPADPFLQGAVAALRALGLPGELAAPDDPRVAPRLRLPADWQVLLQEHSGILAAELAVATLVRRAVARGATLHEQTRVVEVAPLAGGEGVAVTTDGAHGHERWLARQLVATAGPWAPRLLAGWRPPTLPPLTPTHQQVAYFPLREPALWARGQAPLWVFTAEPYLYGFPEHERPGTVKVALELENSALPPEALDPAPLGPPRGEGDGAPAERPAPHFATSDSALETHRAYPRAVDPQALAALAAAVDRHLIGVVPAPAAVELCVYTETPNRHFVVDRHPDHPQILLATGFSGRGFKHAVAVGQLLADLAQSPPGTYDSPWWLPRLGLAGRTA
jgi:glycine/D-amino acid oxidase-like deaminating enzyme